jgi:hypothetical protein
VWHKDRNRYRQTKSQKSYTKIESEGWKTDEQTDRWRKSNKSTKSKEPFLVSKKLSYLKVGREKTNWQRIFLRPNVIEGN